jgi:hypothetical protein
MVKELSLAVRATLERPVGDLVQAADAVRLAKSRDEAYMMEICGLCGRMAGESWILRVFLIPSIAEMDFAGRSAANRYIRSGVTRPVIATISRARSDRPRWLTVTILAVSVQKSALFATGIW